MILKIANRQIKRLLFKQAENLPEETSYQFLIRGKKKKTEDENTVLLVDLKTYIVSNGYSYSIRIQELFEFTPDSSKDEIITSIITKMEEENRNLILSLSNYASVDNKAISMPDEEKQKLIEDFLNSF